MKKKNYDNYDGFNDYDTGPQFDNLDKNVAEKIEVSSSFILLLSGLFIAISLLGYAGNVGDSLFEILTTSLGVFSYLLPILSAGLAYVIYYRKYKIIISKIFIFSLLIFLSLFLILNTFALSGEAGSALFNLITQFIDEPLLLFLLFLTTFVSIISIFNIEKESLRFAQKSIVKTFNAFSKIISKIFHLIKNSINKFFSNRKEKLQKYSIEENYSVSQKLNLSFEEKNKINKSIFTNLNFSNPFKKLFSKSNKPEELKEREVDEAEIESEEFKNAYDIELDENGEGYIIPKKKKSVHEELLTAAKVKLTDSEKEKIKVRKINKKEEEGLENLKINDYPENEELNKKIKHKTKEMEGEDEYGEELSNEIDEEVYVSPPLNLYEEDKGRPSAGDNKANAQTIKRTLQNFQISVEMDEVSVGPTVTRYTLKPAQGVKLSKIAGLDKNLAMDLSTTSIRIEAPIPGKSLVGIEIPNKVKATLGIGTLFANPAMEENTSPLLIGLGKDLHGKPVYVSLSKMPHLLIAGTTGAGKSSSIHGIVQSLIYKNSPNNLKFIMIDPKKVELSLYSKLPHLYTPIIKEPKKAVQVLTWLINEMERRYEVLEQVGKVNIGSYHAFAKDKNYKYKGNTLEKMPYIVVIIDELADFMMAYPKEMESCIVRLAQKSRAVGIHLVLSTQRPSTNVITGVIKGNIPARIALKVVSQIDSRVILDQNGAEKLLGAGDSLFMNSDGSEIKRIQAPFVSEREIERVVDFLKNKYSSFAPVEIALPQNISVSEISGRSSQTSSENDQNLDERYEEAKKIVCSTKIASVTFLQRKMGIGYGRAAKLIDILEQHGIVGPANGSKPREVYGDNGNPYMANNNKNNQKEYELPEDYDPKKDGYLN